MKKTEVGHIFEMEISRSDLELICDVLKISAGEIDRIYKNPGRGLNNKSFVLEVGKNKFLYRISGEGTELFCDRKLEYEAYEILKSFDITDEVIYLGSEDGYKITLYYPDSHVADPHNEAELKKSMELLKRFHSLPVAFPNIDTPYDRLKRYRGFAESIGGRELFPMGFYKIYEKLFEIRNRVDEISKTMVPCHNDYLPNNILFTKERDGVILDLEFTAMSYPLSDISCFCHDGGLGYDGCVKALEYYLGHTSTKKERYELFAYCSIIALMWCSWAVFKEIKERKKRKFYRDYAQMSLDYSRKSLGYII